MASSTCLLERDAALAELSARGRAAVAGHGQVVSVVAAAGVGKTSVIEAVAPLLCDLGLCVFTACAGDQERTLPHAVTRALVEPALADPEVRRAALIDAAAPAAMLLTDSGPPTVPLQHAFYWTVANLAQRTPLALIIDDAHWCDDASATCLAYLARRVGDLPVLLVTAQRPTGQAPWPDGIASVHEHGTELPLDPLSDAGAAAFIAATLTGPSPKISAAFASGCTQATGGNPFYLRELLRDLAGRGVDPESPGLPDAATIAPPAIVRSLLLRMAAIGFHTRVVATACAVLGDRARIDHVARLAGVDLDAAARAVDALVAGAVLSARGPGLRFAHPILRSAVLADVGEHQLARWHLRAGWMLHDSGTPVAEVAAHLVRSDPAGDESVARILLAAAELALDGGSPEAAVELLRRAAAEPPAAADLGGLAFATGRARTQLGDLSALDELRTSIAAADGADIAVERAMAFAEFARKAVRIHPRAPTSLLRHAIGELEQALERPGTTPTLALRAAVERWWIARTDAETSAQVPSAGDASTVAALSGSDPSVARIAAAYLSLVASVAGPPADRDRYLDLALADPGLLAHVAPDSGAVAAVLAALTVSDRHDDHDALCTAVLTEAGRTGNAVGYVVASTYRTLDLLGLGRIDAADAEARAAVRFANEHGWPGAPELLAVRAQVATLRGRPDIAATMIAEAPWDLAKPTNVPIALLAAARAATRLAGDDPQGALSDALAVGSCLRAIGVRCLSVVRWRSTACAALRLLDRPDEARELAEEDLHEARAVGGTAAEAGALRTLAACQDADSAVGTLHQARELLIAGPARLELGFVGRDLGSALRRSGHRAQARVHLTEALDLAERSGAVALARDLRNELRVAGGRPRRTVATGVEALTPAESRVVGLAARGMTNTVIAQTLFVSRKTVEKHLANAYAKLQVTGRTELIGLDLAEPRG